MSAVEDSSFSPKLRTEVFDIGVQNCNIDNKISSLTKNKIEELSKYPLSNLSDFERFDSLRKEIFNDITEKAELLIKFKSSIRQAFQNYAFFYASETIDMLSSDDAQIVCQKIDEYIARHKAKITLHSGVGCICHQTGFSPNAVRENFVEKTKSIGELEKRIKKVISLLEYSELKELISLLRELTDTCIQKCCKLSRFSFKEDYDQKKANKNYKKKNCNNNADARTIMNQNKLKKNRNI